MRKEKALKNMFSSLFSYILLMIFGIIIRRLLLNNYDTEIVGYDGIIADIFSYIALADFGLDNLFNYRLYEAFAKKDNKRLNKLITMYRKLWKILGVIIFVLCSVLYILLPYIFAGKVHNWTYFNIIYILYVLSALSTYFFGYWRSILAASQNEFKAIRIETTVNFITFIGKILALLLSKNLIIYLIINSSTNIISRIIISIICKKEFNTAKNIQIGLKDFKDENMLKECRQLVVIKVADVVNWSSTNLFISILINISTATLYGNYAIIGSAVWSAVSKFTKPITATLADIIHKESKEDSYSYYEMIDMACFIVASTIMSGFTNVFQQAIVLLFGETYLLPIQFCFAYACLYYIAAKSQSIEYYRNCFGDYKTESIFSLLSIIITISISAILVKLLGIVAIIMAIILSCSIIWLSRARIVIKNYYNKSLIKSALRELLFFSLSMLENALVYLCIRNLGYSLLNTIICILISVLMPLVINIVIFHKTKSFKELLNIVMNILKGLKHEGN